MNIKKSLGQKGEDIAYEYLAHKGYDLIERNWRYDHKEIDIIARNNDKIIIVEVKTRSAPIQEEPRDIISLSKIRRIVSAADAYLILNEIDEETRFDVIFIKWYSDTKYEINHIEDAFTSPA